ncbi:MAG: NAD(+) synthase [Bacteroidales bacterium]|nr:NAD(+) synthase [Bacteroidales bacterium]
MTIPSKDFLSFIADQESLDKVAQHIRTQVYGYITKYRLQSLVLGISGGIDSALCAALLKPVCEQAGIPLIGRSITIETNKQDEIDRSIAVGNAFCHNFAHLDLTATFLENKKLLIEYDDSHLSKMRQGNMKARMRMMVLYDLAQLYRGIVISTDNYTEYLTGFWTLHGDVGDYAPIVNLWKTEVFKLAENLLKECGEAQREALQRCIDATPVDGLGISSCDCEQLGVPNYYEADKIFLDYFKGNKEWETHPLIQRYMKSEYKRQNPVAVARYVK